MKIERSLVKGSIEMIMLSEIAESPSHGYGLIVTIRRKYHEYFGPSTIYPLLVQMEKEGIVKSEWLLNSGKPKKLYSITSKGRGLLQVAKIQFAVIARELGEKYYIPEQRT